MPEAVTLAKAVEAGHEIVEHFSRVPMACSANEPEIVRRRGEAMTPDASVDDILAAMRETHPLALRDHDEERGDAVLEALTCSGTWVMSSLVVADFYMGRDPVPDNPRMAYVPLSVRAAWGESDFRRGEQTEEDRREAAEGVAIEYGVFSLAAEAGGRFLAETDAGYINPFIFHGHSIHDELARYVENGMSPAEALATATLNPWIYLD